MPKPLTQKGLEGLEIHLRNAVIDWLLYAGANAGLWSFIDIRHPNPAHPGREGGVSRSPGAADLVVLAGLFDLINPVPVIALAIELKVQDRGQSDDQILWQAKWEAQGGLYIVIRDSLEMPDAFRALGLPMREVAR